MKKAKTIKTRKPKFNVPRSLHEVYPDVQYVKDAAEGIEISVCQKDVDIANKKDPTSCALAQAIKRELKAEAVIIGLSSSYIIKDDTAIRFATPESVQREIVSFDRHHDFQPGDYYLTPKAPTARFGNNTYADKRKNKAGGKVKKARRIHITKNVRVLAKGPA